MSRDWSKYKEELIKRGEILLDPISFGFKAEEKRKNRDNKHAHDGWGDMRI